MEKALQIAPDLGEAHLAQGIYFADGLHDYRRALTEFAIARRASPNSAECLSWSGLTELHLGRWKQGLQYQLKAASLDLFDTQVRRDLIATHCYLRDYPAAERAIELAIIAVPQQANFFRMKLADVEMMKGDLGAARTALESLPPDFESNGFVSYLHARVASDSRVYPEAERWLNHIAEKFGPERTEWRGRPRQTRRKLLFKRRFACGKRIYASDPTIPRRRHWWQFSRRDSDTKKKPSVACRR